MRVTSFDFKCNLIQDAKQQELDGPWSVLPGLTVNGQSYGYLYMRGESGTLQGRPSVSAVISDLNQVRFHAQVVQGGERMTLLCWEWSVYGGGVTVTVTVTDCLLKHELQKSSYPSPVVSRLFRRPGAYKSLCSLMCKKTLSGIQPWLHYVCGEALG